MTKQKQVSKIENETTSFKLKKGLLRRFNALVTRNNTQEDVFEYIISCIENNTKVTKEDLLLLNSKIGNN